MPAKIDALYAITSIPNFELMDANMKANVNGINKQTADTKMPSSAPGYPTRWHEWQDPPTLLFLLTPELANVYFHNKLRNTWQAVNII